MGGKRFTTKGLGVFLALGIGLFPFGALSDGSSMTNGCWIKDNGAKEVLLGNGIVKILITPDKGGACRSMIYQGRELTVADEGLFEDLLISEVYGRGDYCKSPYNYEIVKNTPAEVSLRLWARGKTGMAMYLVMEKTITLFAGSPAIKAEYKILNHPESMAALSYGLRLHNTLRNGGNDRYYRAVAEGTRKIAPAPDGQFYEHNPVRGWEAVVGENGIGAVLLFEPYGKLKSLYNCFMGKFTSVEPFCYELPVDCGKNYEATFWIIPFSGIEPVDEATSSLIVGMTTIDKPSLNTECPLKFKFFSSGTHPGAKVDVSYSILPGKQWTSIGARELPLKANSATETEFPFTPRQEGTYLIKTVVADGAETLLSYVKACEIGKATGQYALKPLEKRLVPKDTQGAKSAETRDFIPAMTIETPSVKWAKPYEKGKTKTLFITDCASGQREVVELAQRIDIDYIAPAVTYSLASHVLTQQADGSISKDDVSCNLDRAIKQPYDVIVLAAPLWDVLSESQRKEISRRISEGTGLIVIEPSFLIKEQDIWEILPVRKPPTLARGDFAAWKAVAPHFMTTGIPVEILPSTTHWNCSPKPGAEVLAQVGKSPLLVAGTYGKGKVAVFNYGVVTPALAQRAPANLTPYLATNPGWSSDLQYWEYWYSLLAKSILWCSDRQSSLLIKAIEPSNAEIDTDNHGDNSIKVELFNDGDSPKPLAVTMYIRYDGAKVMDTVAANMVIGKKNGLLAELKLPPGLKNGLYLADVIIKDSQSGKILNWGSTYFKVKSAVGIQGVTLGSETIHQGELIRGNVNLATGATEIPVSSVLRIDLIDTCGRLVDSTVLNLHNRTLSPLPFQLKSSGTASVLNNLAINLIIDGKIRQTINKSLSIIPEKIDFANDYEVGAWSEIGNSPYYLRPYLFKQLEEIGLTFMMNSWECSLAPAAYRSIVENNFKLACNNLWYSGLTGPRSQMIVDKYRESKDKHALIRTPCLNDSEYRQKRGEDVSRFIKGEALKYAPVAYMTGDEQSIMGYTDPVDLCFSNHCMEKMRDWLRGQYGTLAQLNGEWGTAFKSWEEVEPMTSEEIQSRRDKNFSPWADHRAFMDKTFADNFTYFQKTIKALDNNGIIGFSGTRPVNAYGGYNMPIFLKPFGFICEYTHENLLEYQRCFSNPGTRRAAWMGYGASEPQLNYEIWRNTIHGDNGLVLFVPEVGFINPDFTVGKRGKQFMEHTRELREGLGKQLMHCERSNSGIAIYYSQPSVRASYISGQGQRLQGMHDAYFRVLEEMGLQYDIVSEQDLVTGRIKDFNILIMPFVMALSNTEAEKIRGFASNGGVVLADIQTGIMDEHCKKLERPSLDDLFGIDRTGLKLVETNCKILFDKDHPALQGIGDALKCASMEGGIRATTSKQIAATDSNEPCFFVNDFGKGKAVYAGCNIMSRYGLLRNFKDMPASTMKTQALLIENTMREMLKLAGVESRLEISRNNHALPFCESAFFKSGKMEFLCIVRDYPLIKEKEAENKACDVQIKLKGKAHLYDARKKEYLGFTNVITTSLEPDGGKLYGLLPYKVTSANMFFDKKAFNRGEEVSCHVQIASDNEKKSVGNHVVNFKVYNPDGKLVPLYSKQILTHDGNGEGCFLLALNDPVGIWTVTMQDVITGKACTQKIEVLEN